MKEEAVPCNLCGRDDYSVVYDSPQRADPRLDASDFAASTDIFDRYGRIVRCRGCGLVYTNPRPLPASIAKGYAAAVDEEYAAEAASRSVNAHLSLHVIKKFASGGALLDVGCSTGFFLNAARIDFEARGIEPSAWAAKHAREALKLDVREGPLTPASFPEESFDVVTLIDVIEHLTDPMAALKVVHGLLKPGGLVYLVTPDIDSLSARILRGKWWGLRPAHLYYFSPRTLAEALEKAGFKVVSAGSYGRMFTYGYWLGRLRNYPWWMRAAGEAGMRLFGRENKFLYLNTRDSMEICAIKR